MKLRRNVGILRLLGLLGILILVGFFIIQNRNSSIHTITSQIPVVKEIISPTPLPQIPVQKTLINDYHVFQSFNNCGPAALSMALSYYGIQKSQEELGQNFRPYQVPGGDNDDKSVTLSELAEKSKEFGPPAGRFIPYHRPGGRTETIKQFIAYDMPVITRTWLKPNEDIGHYRVMKGYNDMTEEFIQDDSLQGKNLRYSYVEFDEIWQQFNFEYLVLVPEDKKEIAEAILGENVNELTAWKNALRVAQSKLEKNPNDIHARFNLSVALYHTKDYKRSVEEFEKVENRLSFRTLWYQIEPIRAYYELGRYDRVFAITDKILQNQNRAYSEVYMVRGNIYKNQGKLAEAKSEYEKAILYNRNLKEAHEALASVEL